MKKVLLNPYAVFGAIRDFFRGGVDILPGDGKKEAWRSKRKGGAPVRPNTLSQVGRRRRNRQQQSGRRRVPTNKSMRAKK